MITPSISFDDKAIPQLWRRLTVEDVKELIREDVAELNRLHLLQAEDFARQEKGFTPDYRIRVQIKAWEHIQDTHWSWYRELANEPTKRPQGMGQGFVGSGY